MNVGATATGVVTGKPIHLGGSLGASKPPAAAYSSPGARRRGASGLDLNGARVSRCRASATSAHCRRPSCSRGRREGRRHQDHTGTIVNRRGHRHGRTDAARQAPPAAWAASGRRGRRRGRSGTSTCDILIPPRWKASSRPSARRIKAPNWCSKASTARPCRQPTTSCRPRRAGRARRDLQRRRRDGQLFRMGAGLQLVLLDRGRDQRRLDKIMVGALKRIWDTADRHQITLRTATFAVACGAW